MLLCNRGGRGVIPRAGDAPEDEPALYSYVVANIAKISFERMSRAIVPFLIPLLVVLAGIAPWPPPTTRLPQALIGR
jgi:hypothetical protein